MAGKLSKARAQRTSPNVTVHVAAPSEPEQPAKPRRWVEWSSLVVALGAAAFAGATYIDQSGVNSITQERYERRYADRVAWWTERKEAAGKPAKRVLLVQNRSPVPIRDVAAAVYYSWTGPADQRPPLGPTVKWVSGPGAPGSAAWSTYELDDVAPCTIVEFVMPYTTPDFGAIQYVDFYDPEGRWWSRSGNQLFDVNKTLIEEEADGGEKYMDAVTRRLPAEGQGSLSPTTRQAAEDCTDS